MRRGRQSLIAVAVSAAIGATAAMIVVSTVGGSHSAGPPAAAAAQGTTNSTVIKEDVDRGHVRRTAATGATGPAEQSMSVFSQPRVSSDAVPAALTDSMSGTLSDSGNVPTSLQPGALDFSNSRLLASDQGRSLYGVPTSSGHVCVTDWLDRGGCVDTFAHFEGSVSWGVGEPPDGGNPVIDGTFADGVASIVINLGDGTSAPATTGRNGFIYVAPSPTTAIKSMIVTFSDGSNQTVDVGYNPVTPLP